MLQDFVAISIPHLLHHLPALHCLQYQGRSKYPYEILYGNSSIGSGDGHLIWEANVIPFMTAVLDLCFEKSLNK